jgi:hypothetical protein
MEIYIAVEGSTDHLVVQALLSSEESINTRIVTAGGRSAVSSIARTLLVKYQKPLVVMVDTDSLESSAVQETQSTMQQLLGAVAGDAPFRVICCVPELEAIFFQANLDLKRLFPQSDTAFFLMYARSRPKDALKYLFQNGGGPKALPDLLGSLSRQDIDFLRSTGPIKELVEFISRMIQPVTN